mmetsp:Transcript_32876/g.50267  ORF Transcript_32876/g.50267 Transcript_32876/m.50267 type:complete len:276 (-) Transcript_32876:166-993(-)
MASLVGHGRGITKNIFAAVTTSVEGSQVVRVRAEGARDVRLLGLILALPSEEGVVERGLSFLHLLLDTLFGGAIHSIHAGHAVHVVWVEAHVALELATSEVAVLGLGLLSEVGQELTADDVRSSLIAAEVLIRSLVAGRITSAILILLVSHLLLEEILHLSSGQHASLHADLRLVSRERVDVAPLAQLAQVLLHGSSTRGQELVTRKVGWRLQDGVGLHWVARISGLLREILGEAARASEGLVTTLVLLNLRHALLLGWHRRDEIHSAWDGIIVS